MEVNGQIHTSTVSPRRKSSWHLWNRMLFGPQSRSELFGEDKTLLPLSGIEVRLFIPWSSHYTDIVQYYYVSAKLVTCVNSRRSLLVTC